MSENQQQPQRYPPQGYPPQGYPPQGYPPQGYPPQGYPPQGYPPQGYPPQGYPPQEYLQHKNKNVLYDLEDFGAVCELLYGLNTVCDVSNIDQKETEEQQQQHKTTILNIDFYIFKHIIGGCDGENILPALLALISYSNNFITMIRQANLTIEDVAPQYIIFAKAIITLATSEIAKDYGDKVFPPINLGALIKLKTLFDTKFKEVQEADQKDEKVQEIQHLCIFLLSGLIDAAFSFHLEKINPQTIYDAEYVAFSTALGLQQLECECLFSSYRSMCEAKQMERCSS